MSTYAWSLLDPYDGTLGYEPDPVDPDDDQPDPVDPDDDEPDPVDPDDDQPDPPDPEASFAIVALADHSVSTCTAWGYERISLIDVMSAFENDHGPWQDLWAKDPDAALLAFIQRIQVAFLNGLSGLEPGGAVPPAPALVNAGSLPIGAQWAAAGWARHRKYAVID